jgi:hypothetical protein
MPAFFYVHDIEDSEVQLVSIENFLTATQKVYKICTFGLIVESMNLFLNLRINETRSHNHVHQIYSEVQNAGK